MVVAYICLKFVFLCTFKALYHEAGMVSTIAHTEWTHTWTTMRKGSGNGFFMGPPLPISIVKPKRGVGSHVEKGWDPAGPTASHRTRFASQVEKSWDLPGPTGPDLGLTVRLASALLYVGVQWDAVGPGVRGGGPMIAS